MSPVSDPLPLGPLDVKAAAARIAGRVRPLALAPAGPSGEQPAGRPADRPGPGGRVTFALEYLQHTGSFKARGAANLAAAHLQDGSMPAAGVTIASGGNAGLACAWAARATVTRATVFLPENAPAFKVEKLRGYGADVRLEGDEYADALAASIAYAADTGALLSHAYDNPLIAAGAGTLAAELLARCPDVDTIMVAVGGGGLFSGVAAAVADSAVKVVAVEPEHSRALHAALESGGPVDAPVDSIAADSLGARRASSMAWQLAQGSNVCSVLVGDEAIVSARRRLWEEHRVVVEHGGATAYAALLSGAYQPADGEHVVVVLCGANTDPGSVIA
jgi:threonine dehydratase